jgi:hypothetical protein
MTLPGIGAVRPPPCVPPGCDQVQRIVAKDDVVAAVEEHVPLLFVFLGHRDDTGDQAAIVEFDGQLPGELAAVEDPAARQHRFAAQRQTPAVGLIGDQDFVPGISVAIGQRAPRLEVQPPTVVQAPRRPGISRLAGARQRGGVLAQQAGDRGDKEDALRRLTVCREEKVAAALDQAGVEIGRWRRPGRPPGAKESRCWC